MTKASAAKKKASERWSLPATQARSRATREKLLEAAETVFAAKGYTGAKISDIAAEAGCSVGSVYFRFKDKDALFFAIRVYVARHTTPDDHVAALLGLGDHLLDSVLRLLAISDNLQRRQILFRLLFFLGLPG